MSRIWTRRGVLQVAGALALAPVLPRWAWAELPALVGATMGTFYRIRIGPMLQRLRLDSREIVS